ncbi:hypothetical protein [Methanoregula sp.]|uniref:hypothetical protein n=1 Tax=Methanoregula sp. TaxID=2052170 RepID=UPI003BB0D32D
MERNYVGAGPVLNLAKPALWENPGSIQVHGNPFSGPVSPGRGIMRQGNGVIIAITLRNIKRKRF